MPLEITFELSDKDLDHFRAVMQAARERAGDLDENVVVEEQFDLHHGIDPTDPDKVDDQSELRILRFQQDFPTARVVQLSRNFGHPAAITAGLERQECTWCRLWPRRFMRLPTMAAFLAPCKLS